MVLLEYLDILDDRISRWYLIVKSNNDIVSAVPSINARWCNFFERSENEYYRKIHFFLMTWNESPKTSYTKGVILRVFVLSKCTIPLQKKKRERDNIDELVVLTTSNKIKK